MGHPNLFYCAGYDDLILEVLFFHRFRSGKHGF